MATVNYINSTDTLQGLIIINKIKYACFGNLDRRFVWCSESCVH